MKYTTIKISDGEGFRELMSYFCSSQRIINLPTPHTTELYSKQQLGMRNAYFNYRNQWLEICFKIVHNSADRFTLCLPLNSKLLNSS